MKMVKIFLVLAIMASMAVTNISAETARTAKIESLRGSAEVKHVNEKRWVPVKVGLVLNEGDIIRTKKNSETIISINGDTESAMLVLQENSHLTFFEMSENKDLARETTFLDLAIGEVLVTKHKIEDVTSEFEVKTPTSIVAVKGGSSKFSVSVEQID
ncbi:FecR domain-containing protein [Candidatus Omnitrophota bacterium]